MSPYQQVIVDATAASGQDAEYIEETYNVVLDKENPIRQNNNAPSFQDPTQLGFFV